MMFDSRGELNRLLGWYQPTVLPADSETARLQAALHGAEEALAAARKEIDDLRADLDRNRVQMAACDTLRAETYNQDAVVGQRVQEHIALELANAFVGNRVPSIDVVSSELSRILADLVNMGVPTQVLTGDFHLGNGPDPVVLEVNFCRGQPVTLALPVSTKAMAAVVPGGMKGLANPTPKLDPANGIRFEGATVRFEVDGKMAAVTGFVTEYDTVDSDPPPARIFPEVASSACECGTAAVGGGIHSSWCPCR